MQETENEAFVRPLLKRGTALSVETRQVIVGFAIVLLVTIIGMLLPLQGWKSRPPAFDMLTYFNSAEHLLKTGTPARYGDVSSYGSFPPGGTTWLIAPGMLLFHDPEGVGLRYEHDVLHEGARSGDSRRLVHLRSGRVLGAGVARAVINVDDELALDVVAPGDDPRAERDEEPEQEHADEHGHGCGERCREVCAERAHGLREEKLDAFYDS